MKEYQGQLLISTGAVQWTTDCSKALNAISGGNKTALKALKKKQVGGGIVILSQPFKPQAIAFPFLHSGGQPRLSMP